MSQRGFGTWFLAAAVVLALKPPPAEAATTHCASGDVVCLIAAINSANADSKHETIIRLGGGTYVLTDVDNIANGPNGLPSIASTVTIDGGSDGTTLTRAHGGLPFRFLHVGPIGRLNLQRLHLVGGESVRDSSVDRLAGSGGALLNDRGLVTIVDSSFDNNFAEAGGAVYTSQGTMTILDSTLHNNQSGFGGGAGLVSSGGVVTLTRTAFENNSGIGAGGFLADKTETHITECRFSGNGANLGVGGLYVLEGTASISNTTFSGNFGDGVGALFVDTSGTIAVRESAFIDNPGFFGGPSIDNHGTMYVTNTTFALVSIGEGSGRLVGNSGQMTIVNSTLTENAGGRGLGPGTAILTGTATTYIQNTVVFSPDPTVLDCVGAITSLGHNLIRNPSSCLVTVQASDLVGDAGLGELIDDGTPGNAHFPLVSTSQAIDAADDAVCPRKDQLGRPRAPQCDIGAVEFQRGPLHASPRITLR
jgi:hypothetical protein